MNTQPAGHRTMTLAAGLLLAAATLAAQDWPQWLGPNRDGKAAGFKAPATWPKELVQKWKVTLGPGDATPALADGKLYVFARDEGGEITVCLDADTGKELWRDKYDALPAQEPMGRHPGPRSSPAVAAGKVVTYGVRGTLSCLDAATGKMLWRRDDAAGVWPRFFTASSPLLLDGVCVMQIGSEEKGATVAYDLATGEPKWKWSADGSAYSSPVVVTVGGAKIIAALSAKRLVGLGLTEGKLLWDTPFAPPNRAYNASTPVVDGQTVIWAGSGRGTKAAKIEKAGDQFTLKELWANPDNAVQFNTPVLKGGQLYGLSQAGALFCLDAQSGKTLWTAPVGGRDFGSIVEAGPVLLVLTPLGELMVVEPSDKEFKKLAGYKVGADTYACPVPAGNRVFVKDKDSVTAWSVE
jgi:outer membrane protein assembly factor BamB